MAENICQYSSDEWLLSRIDEKLKEQPKDNRNEKVILIYNSQKEIYEEVLSVISYQGNANYNHPCQNDC